jgi:hypothetical protein
MSPDDFRELLKIQTDVQLLEPCLRDEAPPFVCEDQSNLWDSFRDEFVSRLGVTRADIRIVGSGRLGFSLKPWKNLQAFSDTSDIDVVIVSADLFDRLWVSLLEVVYPRPPMIERIAGWVAKRRNEVYTGWLTPLAIKIDRSILGPRADTILDIKSRWFGAVKEAARHPSRRHENVAGRLYRTWRHAELYHLHSLAELRRSLNP